jgi:hypothetical protein
MKRLFATALLCAFSCCLHAQAADATVDTTVCDILKNPVSFNGKMVRIKGTVSAGLDYFVVQSESCGQGINAIWLAYPDGTKGKAGPLAAVELEPAHNFTGTVDAAPRTAVTLDKSKDFKKFDSLLASSFKESSMCLACGKYTVSATLVGRLDGVATAGVRRDNTGKIVGWSGFGNASEYAARLVLQSVADIAEKEVDYSKAAAETKSDQPADASVSQQDATASAHAAAKAFGAGNAAGDQIERAAAAFGKEGDDNGVNVGFGSANEVPRMEGSKGAHDSPDGVLYNCTLNLGRLSGNALTRAIVHTGTMIADLRAPAAGSEGEGLYEREYRAWANTTFSAAASGQKTMTVTGGYLMWNSAWPVADRTGLLDTALKAVIADEGLTRQ